MLFECKKNRKKLEMRSGLKTRLITLWWLLAGMYLQTAVAAPSASLSFNHILASEVESVGYVVSIAQDNDGFMWFGGANGLARFDGYELTIYRAGEEQSTLSHSYINRILMASDGRMWLATRNGVNLFNPALDRFTAYRYDDQNSLTLSANDVNDILEDSEKRMWLATRGGFFAFNPDTGAFTHVPFKQVLELDTKAQATDEIVWKCVQDKNGIIWLGTHTYGVVRFDPASNTFKHYAHNSGDDNSISNNDARELFVDSKNNVWVGTYGSGLHVYDRERDQFNRFEHHSEEKSNIIWDVLEDSAGNIWIGDGSAAHVLDPVTGEFSRFRHSENDPSSPGNHVVNSLFEDNAGDMWLGFFPSGVDVVDKQASAFRNYRHNPSNINSVASGGILTGYEDTKGNLWVGAGYGLSYFDRAAEQFKHYVHHPEDPASLSANTILSVIEDSQGTLWAGVWAGGLNRLDAGSNSFTRYLPEEGNPQSLLGWEPWSVIESHDQAIWIASDKGISRYNRATDDFTRFEPPLNMLDGDKSLYARVIYEDRLNQIWVGSTRGLFKLTPATGEFIRYKHIEGDTTSLSADFVKSVYEDSRGVLWVGTDGGGVNKFDAATQTFTSYSVKHGLPNNVVTGIIEDDEGYLWFSTQKGLSRFSPVSQEVRNYSSKDGLVGNLFNRNTPVKTRSGELFFGSSKGFTLFNPRDLKENEYSPPVVLTDLQIFNVPVKLGQPDSPLTNTLHYSQAITLDYTQSVFMFEFAALNFRSPENNQYAYKLVGFDTGWNHVGSKRTATYTNLDPGSYQFKVIASNNEGLWNTEGTSIGIVILPPYWKTWWAYTLYIILFIALLTWFIYQQRQKVSFERQKVEQERSVVRRLKQLDKLKDEFLANTSHELRTPLNGIVGLAESLMDGVTGPLSHKTKQNLAMIVSSGKRLAGLVDDLLDFAQLKHRGMALNKKTVDIHVLVDVVLSLTLPIVGAKPIELVNNVSKQLPKVAADESRLLQILHNLVGNAVKFTDEGSVTISADVQGEEICVSVADTGIGVPENRFEEIFDSFRQLEGAPNRVYGGTGLGLSVTKQLVELHGGTIGVRSTLGKGATFYFYLPLNAAIEDEADGQEPEASSEYLAQLSSPEEDLNEPVKIRAQVESKGDTARIYHILIVDDEPVNRKVLANYLSLKYYTVHEVRSGMEAITYVRNGPKVDLILLDIMMPKMSGYEACKQLRQQYSANELPIILLTARSQVSDLVMGFNSGANDFITKPIAKEELLARVHTHLQLRDITLHLDSKVAERTAELAVKSEKLEETKLILQKANEKLEQASLTDSLTGLRNRRFLNNSIAADIAIANRAYKGGVKGDAPLASDLIFIVLDIDCFKEINDTYGHRSGDRMLEQISQQLRSLLRESDYAIRWGGEEFLLVIRFVAREGAEEVVERIRSTIEAFEFELENGEKIKRTCSMGYACYPFNRAAPTALSWEQVIDAADRALYIAKSSGRNCWVGISQGAAPSNEPPGVCQDLGLRVSQGEFELKASARVKEVSFGG
ncbi:diguanylate cyclase [Saccharophagus degradans]|uniref:two-component regulator propeller domain-containing protein n=1 Tax=Saccharophagus degradans TaxID=86304 RepID=UPI001C085D72|nr:two-component regulator propeller domain-containing protein [Saccharophagus degradans]MBU2983783.1 diguanylate cyclase [Saccharophagus degradans]